MLQRHPPPPILLFHSFHLSSHFGPVKWFRALLRVHGPVRDADSAPGPFLRFCFMSAM